MELAPHGVVAIGDVFGGLDRFVGIAAALHRGEIGQAERDVLDEDLDVVGSLPIGQCGVDLTRLRVDEIRLDPVTVPSEQGIRE